MPLTPRRAAALDRPAATASLQVAGGSAMFVALVAQARAPLAVVAVLVAAACACIAQARLPVARTAAVFSIALLAAQLLDLLTC